MKGDLFEGLFENTNSDPLGQPSCWPMHRRGRRRRDVTAPLAWLAWVLPVVRSADQLVVALLLRFLPDALRGSAVVDSVPPRNQNLRRTLCRRG